MVWRRNARADVVRDRCRGSVARDTHSGASRHTKQHHRRRRRHHHHHLAGGPEPCGHTIQQLNLKQTYNLHHRKPEKNSRH